MTKRILTLIAALVLLCNLHLTVYAHEVPDMTRKGSVDIVMRSGEKTVAGGELSLYRVGDVYEYDGNYSFVPAGIFAECVSAYDSTNLQSSELPAKLAAFIKENSSIKPVATKTVDGNGYAEFDGMELGLYLVVQTKAASGYSPAGPFLVTMPRMENGKYVYDFSASPKVSIPPKLTPPPAKPSDDKLPQTGQLNWPVPLLAVTGMILFTMGWMLYAAGKREKNES